MANGDVFYTSMEWILDDQPKMTELLKYVVVAHWFTLESLLELNKLRLMTSDLALCLSCGLRRNGKKQHKEKRATNMRMNYTA